MNDDIIDKFFNKYLKGWVKRNYKFLIVILLYLLYQSNFVIALLYSFGININMVNKTPRIFLLMLIDSSYVITLILMFKEEINNGIKKLKKNFLNNATLSLTCWVIGCVIMTVSSFIISLILKQNVSDNEALVRESIKIAPIYMLFACSIIAPIFEEMVFRRALYGLIKCKGLFILVSGLSFGLLHVVSNNPTPLEFLYVIPYGSMGCAFAYLLSKTNNITLPIIIHMLHNTILVSIQILGG